MVRFKKINRLFLGLALLFFSLEYIATRYSLDADLSEIYSNRLIKASEKKKADFADVFQNDSILERLKGNRLSEADNEYFAEKRVIALAFKEGIITGWNTVSVDNTISIYADSQGFGLAEVKRGWYLYENKKTADGSVMLCYPIYRKYQVSNPLLDEGFNRDIGINANAEFSLTEQNEYIKIVTPLLPPFYVDFETAPTSTAGIISLIFFGLALLFIFLFIFNLFEFLQFKYGFPIAWISMAAMVFIIRLLSFELRIPGFLYATHFFSPEIYASSTLLPSLGDLFIDSLLLFLVFFSAYKGFLTGSVRGSYKYKKYFLNFKVKFVVMVGLILMTVLILSILQSLINDSRISFNITNILDSGIYTMVGLLIAAMLLITHFLVINVAVTLVHRFKIESSSLLGTFFLALALVVFGLWITNNLQWLLMLQAVCYLIALYITYLLVIDQNYFQKTLALIFVISMFAASLLYRTLHEKEMEMRKLVSNKVYSPKDLNAESVFLEIENKLEHDPFVRNYFKNPLLLKTQLEKRIKQLYFTGYLSRYDVDIYDFDTLGNSFKELNYYQFDFLNTIYKHKTQGTLSNHFFYINDASLRFGYIAKFEICTPEASLGVIYILLKPKFVQDEKIFTELLSKTSGETRIDPSEYSYAIYQNDVLMHQSGDFPYTLEFTFDTLATGRYFTEEDGYSHLVSHEQGGMMVIVSKKLDSFLEPLTVFSFLFLVFSVFAILVFLINALIIYTRLMLAKITGRKRTLVRVYMWLGRLIPYRKYRGIYFSTRIQTVMIGLVLFAMLFTGYFTIEYISFKYKERQNQRLEDKVKSIISAIENESRFESMMDYPDEVSAYLNQLAEFYNTDINLFDLDGALVASTQYRIFQSGLLLDRIHPTAYTKIYTEKKSQFTQTERIGKLEYLASYVPVFDSRHRLVAYLNIPFFSNKEELSEELSSFLVNFINIYVFFFIMAGVTALVISQRITAPLTFIQAKLAAIRLGNKNELLEWKQNDEIGQLVRQYNNMVEQLEQSVDLLSKSEREGAWKEMAKQIAHEIKNPLTPMKLSVQHLQRAWSVKSENLDQTFKRVTAVLIEQIDSLSLLATEFSSFAQMPVAKIEEFELTDVLNSIVELYFNSENITITYKASTQRLPVKTDRHQLSRVFNNVIKNAIQAIPEDKHGLLDVTVEAENDFAVVTISDNGEGIPADMAQKIFSPSFSTKNSGMGLGLAISKQIIESAGGKIWFESEAGKGTNFFISLPLQKSDDSDK